MRARSRAIAQLDGLPPKERLKLFGGLFGDLTPAVEAAWQSLKKSTYQVGYARKSFRAPSDPEAALDLREGWLTSMVSIVEQYRPGVVTPEWLAAWASHLRYFANQDDVGRLLAAVIDSGGPTADAVFDVLCRSARNEHEIGTMGRHVPRALLMASRPEGWELIEKMLLAAQRQEGLRQVILETVDEAHPEAFRRMLRLVRDHDLARYSSVVRAANVWFGLAWDSVSVKTVNATIERVLGYLDDPKARDKALAGSDPEAIFLALWSIAFDDALAAIPVAAKLLGDKRVEVRYVAALHLAQLHLPQTQSVRVAAIDDDDPRVALCALEGAWFAQGERPEPFEGEAGPFERIERLIHRLPAKPVTLKPLVWPWTERKASREDVAWYLVRALGHRPPMAVIP